MIELLPPTIVSDNNRTYVLSIQRLPTSWTLSYLEDVNSPTRPILMNGYTDYITNAPTLEEAANNLNDIINESM